MRPSRMRVRVDCRLAVIVALSGLASLGTGATAQDASPAPSASVVPEATAASSPAAQASTPASPAPDASAATSPDDGASPPASPGAAGLDRIDLPNGWQPEGIAALGDRLFVGSLADGAIWRGDPATGEGSVLVPGSEGAVSVGLEADEANGRLWVAGGDTGEVRAYAADTGELLETYKFEAGFLNDLVVTPEAVYVTDSFMPQILVVPLGEGGALPAADETEVLSLGGDIEYGEGFNVNGIEAVPAGLVVVHSSTGELFRVDPASGEATRIDLGDATLTAGDGLTVDGSTLYVVRNELNQIAVLELDEGATSATQVAELTNEGFDVPTTVAVMGDDLWAVNARFGTDPTPETEYWITRLDAPVQGG